ncbi:microfibril-associated glycoprotein 4-like isoform X1 [Girardinichthys multiradiatus]|uniref:microfibril-associated glycoprotein 4-like isoform X1 n=2 Tax=Girardinichthys multiradiatus TaxID=208333 RepID=UPI001FAE0880|nr:microfibril-associated glycoprotein 4-like isoform X1 [Girardinichthys multiradiatus]
MMKLLSVVFLLLVPMMSRCSKLALPLDCSDVHEKNSSVPSGVYTIYPIGATSAVQVYCDMDSLEGKWTVFQRRMDGSVNFYRPWEEYKMGFGNAAGEYWLGLESLFHLTQRKNYQLLVDMEDFEGKKVYARYSTFSIDSESNGYRLHVSGFTDGGAGDSLTYHSEQKFLTFDLPEGSCARSYLGAFWYKTCHYANPNGVYLWGAHNLFRAVGVEWFHWKGYEYSLKAISMKIHPVQ